MPSVTAGSSPRVAPGRDPVRSILPSSGASVRPVKKTKIVCTIGPASREPAVLESLMRAGMDVARLNFSHGSHDDHRASMRAVREASRAVGRPVAVLQDLQGPKIRVGRLAGGRMELVNGQLVSISYAREQTDLATIPTTYAELAADIHVGATILMDDGLLRLEVIGEEGDVVRCEVKVGGVLRDKKGINLPGVRVSAPSLTEKDLEDLAFGAELGVDYVGLSFVRAASDVTQAKERLLALGKRTPVIAKIETPEAVADLEAILEVADGILVARGDLGVEIGPEKVPLVQKECIEQANRRGKLVITATQMLESMVTSTFPTRAEASDVANAVLDQTDAVMLSGETATGAHPALCVETMVRIIAEIEGSERYRRLAALPPLDLSLAANAIAHAAAAAASSLAGVSAIACVSFDGGTATLLSDYRPRVPIFALCADAEACRRLAAFWGVHPLEFVAAGDEAAESIVQRVAALLRERGAASCGAPLLVTLASGRGGTAHTDTLTIRTVSEG